MPDSPATTIRESLAQITSAGLMPIEAEFLMLVALGKPITDRAWLRTNPDHPLPAPTATLFQALAKRRLQNEPIAYITGQKEFYGVPLRIDARVLDPRSDTETLVDWALEVLVDSASPRVVDLGTGSGAIALAIKHRRSDALVVAIDASTDALALAKSNAEQLGLNVVFMSGNWLEPLTTAHSPQHADFQLIVSNPPYIAEGDPHLSALRHEPISALTSGPDGLMDIRHIIQTAPCHLCSGGWLLMEHGYDQEEAVRDLMQRQGFENVQSRKDLAGIARCTGGIWSRDMKTG